VYSRTVILATLPPARDRQFASLLNTVVLYLLHSVEEVRVYDSVSRHDVDRQTDTGGSTTEAVSVWFKLLLTELENVHVTVTDSN